MSIKIFSGTYNPALAHNVANNLGLSLGKATIGRFSDGEVSVTINENVRGQDIFLIQSTSYPCNDSLMELIIMTDALRRASAGSITVVIPYYPYARQDRRARSSRVPVSAKVVADMITNVGATRLVTVDLHAEQIQGFFHIPVDNIYSTQIMLDDVKRRKLANIAVVSPDVGGVVRARAIAKLIPHSNLVIIDKRRSKANESEVMHIIGDVKGKSCLLMDDIIDTAGTICKAAKALKQEGAHDIFAYCTHPVLSGNAIETINNSELKKLIVTDSLCLNGKAQKCDRIEHISLADVIAETISRIDTKQSVSVLFE